MRRLNVWMKRSEWWILNRIQEHKIDMMMILTHFLCFSSTLYHIIPTEAENVIHAAEKSFHFLSYSERVLICILRMFRTEKLLKSFSRSGNVSRWKWEISGVTTLLICWEHPFSMPHVRELFSYSFEHGIHLIFPFRLLSSLIPIHLVGDKNTAIQLMLVSRCTNQ